MSGGRFAQVRRFAELDSTNRYLLDEARAGAAEGLVVVADHQTAGRGRLGRRWEAPAGTNLLASILLRPALAVDQLHLATTAMALAARQACKATVGLEPVLKWPNDLMVGERKLAGILAEAILAGAIPAGAIPAGATGNGEGEPRAGADGSMAVVVGIGLNVAWPRPDSEPGGDPVPAELAGATSLWRETGVRVAVDEVLAALLADLEGRLDDLGDAIGRRRLAVEYREVCTTLGRQVRVDLEGATLTGAVVDITPDGHLLLDVGTCIKTVTAGDVVHLRA
jgi:BirA family transcriptional regulator, biotin operon repressor / biotin---[acetyl-CoA-carboxylase] ligase